MRVLVVSPHADDETIGAGGTLLKYKHHGHKIFWLNITDMKQEYGYSSENVEKRQKEIKAVIKNYGMDGFFNLGLKPAGLDTYKKSYLVQSIFDVVKNVQPHVVILPYEFDVHSDHRIVFDAAFSCTKIFRCNSIKKILCMEILSETDFALSDQGFVPNYFVDVSDYIEEKVSIVNNYESEIKDVPFPRSEENIKALARYRGATAGTEYAEAFRVVKIIE